VLRMLKRRCLAKLRHEVEPVPPQVLAAFLPAWQDALHDASRWREPAGPQGGAAEAGWQPRRRSRIAGPDAVYAIIEQLAGSAVPASALESLIFPARVNGYAPAMLDELTAAGDVVWAGAGSLPGGDGWLVLTPADSAPLLLPPPGEITMTPVHDAVLTVLEGGGALFFRGLADRVVAKVTAAGGSGGSSPQTSTAGGSSPQTSTAGGSSPQTSTAGGSGGSSPQTSTAERAGRGRAPDSEAAASRVRTLNRVSDQA